MLSSWQFRFTAGSIPINCWHWKKWMAQIWTDQWFSSILQNSSTISIYLFFFLLKFWSKIWRFDPNEQCLILKIISTCLVKLNSVIPCNNARYSLVPFNAVQQIMIFHITMPWHQQNINQTLNSQKTPYLILMGELWVSFVRILNKIVRIVMAPHYIVCRMAWW